MPTKPKPLSRYSNEEVLAIYAECGNNAAAAARKVGCGPRTFQERIKLLRDTVYQQKAAEDTSLAFIEEELEARGLDPRDVTFSEAIIETNKGEWEGFYKNKDDEGVVVPLNKDHRFVRIKVKKKFEPPFPFVNQPTPTTFTFDPSSGPYIAKGWWEDVIISDAQIGYLRDLDDYDKLEPIHDPAAIRVAQKIVADVKPKRCVFIGDWMDWTTFSRWQQRPEFRDVINPSIQTGYEELGNFKVSAGPQCQMIMVGSNHQLRVEQWMLENNMAHLGMKRAQSKNGPPDGWPVHSEGFLLRYDELGIEFTGQHGSAYWLTDNFAAVHNEQKRLELQGSYIHGHSHKLTRDQFVQHGYDNQRFVYFRYDTGCLCQTGVTENKKRLLVTRVPSGQTRTNWAQGISIITFVGGKNPKHDVRQIHIEEGSAFIDGEIYDAT
jgi:hypothetical protein